MGTCVNECLRHSWLDHQVPVLTSPVCYNYWCNASCTLTHNQTHTKRNYGFLYPINPLKHMMGYFWWPWSKHVCTVECIFFFFFTFFVTQSDLKYSLSKNKNSVNIYSLPCPLSLVNISEASHQNSSILLNIWRHWGLPTKNNLTN